MRIRFATLAAAFLLATSALATSGGSVMAAGYTAPLPGYTTVLPGQSRSGTLTRTGSVPTGLGYNQVDFQILTDQLWSTYADGRQIVFFLACSFDGGLTYPWTEGPFTFVPPALGKNGSSPIFGAWIPSNCNGWQANYIVEDASGNTGPSIDFGIAVAPVIAGG